MKDSGKFSTVITHFISNTSRETLAITFIMILGAIHGVIYMLIIPPWQHYEEPTQFEYIWMISTKLSLPDYLAYDQEERQVIASSMIEHRFFRNLDFLPDLNSEDQPIWIGISKTGALPLYHILQAIPLHFVLNTGVDTQLRVLRFFSFLYYLTTIYVAYMIVGEFVPRGHALRWMVPAGIALIPSFTDLMTAVSDDVGATLFFSLFTLASVRMIMRGFSLPRVVGLLGSAILCAFTKSTVIVALPLSFLAIILCVIKPRLVYVGFFAVIILSLMSVLLIFSWGDAAFWYRYSNQPFPSRVGYITAPNGQYVFQLHSTASSRFEQTLTREASQAIKGKVVTLGAWVWSNRKGRAFLPAISTGYEKLAQVIDVNKIPTFHSLSATIDNNAEIIKVILKDASALGEDPPFTVYYDSIILAIGDYSNIDPPILLDEGGGQIIWGDNTITNLLRNGSAEKPWPWIRPWLQRLFAKFNWLYYMRPSLYLGALLDFGNTGWLYKYSAWNIFQTFWAAFGWANVRIPLILYQVILAFNAVSIIALVACSFLIIKSQKYKWNISLLYLVCGLLIIWGIDLTRGFFTVDTAHVYIPVARYGYPVIIATMIFLTGGWHLIYRYLMKWEPIVFLGTFVILDIISVIVIIQFYSGVT